MVEESPKALRKLCLQQLHGPLIIPAMAPITSSSRKTSYAPATPTTAFPINFPLADNTDLKVVVNGVTRTDFTVAATYLDGLSYDAIVNMNTAVTGSVVIYGQRIPRRTNQFQDGRPLNLTGEPIANADLVNRLGQDRNILDAAIERLKQSRVV
ncbi:hypothetical protein [Rhizobium sp. SYY.PMSO]|uniref:hypothetical protein n=1 Tax=Rhizobium sp. SYY.PMSO TaxID=3382192 RepID=UPI00398F908F